VRVYWDGSVSWNDHGRAWGNGFMIGIHVAYRNAADVDNVVMLSPQRSHTSSSSAHRPCSCLHPPDI